MKTITAILRKITACKLIKMPQLMLLLMASKDKTGWNVADIADATGAKPSVITMAKNKLIRDALIIEHVPHRDRRRTKVYLTDAGRYSTRFMWKALRDLVDAEEIIRPALGGLRRNLRDLQSTLPKACCVLRNPPRQ